THWISRGRLLYDVQVQWRGRLRGEIGQHRGGPIPFDRDRLVLRNDLRDLRQRMIADHTADFELSLPDVRVPFRVRVVAAAAPACLVANILLATVTDVITVSQHSVHERIAAGQAGEGAVQLVKMLEKKQDRITGINLRFQIVEAKTAPKRD